MSKYKILGTGNGFKAEIVAMSASTLAIEKMKKAGGNIIVSAEKEDVRQHIVKEVPEKEEKKGKKKK